MLQNYIIFYRNNELWKAKEKHGTYCSIQTRDDQDNGRNGEKYTDSKCYFGGRHRINQLINESDMVGKGKGITQKNALGFWLKQLDRGGVI